MGNITRRQDQGLGKTAAGGSGGSFATHERVAAAPPPQSAQRTPDEYARLVDQAEQTQRHFRDMQARMQQQAEQLYDLQIAARIKQKYPDAAEFIMAEDGGGEAVWRFSALKRSDGSEIEIESFEAEDEMDSLAFDSPRPVPYSKREYASHTINLDEALNVDPASLRRRYIDTDGDFDDASFSRLWSNASANGDLIGNVRSWGDFEQELRVHLSERANELNDSERETFFDEENIDTWVEAAMERYVSNRPDDEADSRAFYDAVQAASPHDH